MKLHSLLLIPFTLSLAWADVTYTYNGKPFTSTTTSPVPGASAISFQMVFTSAIPPNSFVTLGGTGWNGTICTVHPKSWSLTDGAHTITSSDPGVVDEKTGCGYVRTDNTGSVSEWSIDYWRQAGQSVEMLTSSIPIPAWPSDGVVLYSGDYVSYNRDSPGTWTVSMSCQVSACSTGVTDNCVGLFGTGGTSMYAQFTPPSGSSLTAAASACGFQGFDWVQTVEFLPSPSPFATVNNPSTPLTAPLAFRDPPDPSGYTYGEETAGRYPFFYNPTTLSTECAQTNLVGSCILDVIIDFGTSQLLNFADSPWDPCFVGGIYAGTAICHGSTAPAGSYVRFKTVLVGVVGLSPGAIPSPPLFEWEWIDSFNGTSSGSIAQLSGNRSPDPTTGTGGIAITVVNGIALNPISSTQIAIMASGLAYSRVSQTFNGTLTIKNISTSPIDGPIQIVLMSLTPGVTLANATGKFVGNGYITAPLSGGLAAEQSATVAVQFKNPANAKINFTPVIYSGSLN